jgi:hypothetical protein
LGHAGCSRALSGLLIQCVGGRRVFEVGEDANSNPGR